MNNTVDSPAFWDEKYRLGETEWDMKSATPAFVELLNSKKFIQPGKLLITGSGKGYDAIAAAKAGYDVTAVDFSFEAVFSSRKIAEQNAIKINFIVEDIFNLNQSFIETFDSVYDYTTYCAINPIRHEEYIKKITSLLKYGGKFVALLFPVEDRKDGPPFGIDPLEFYSIAKKYLKLEFSSRRINSIKPRKGREVLQIYIK